MTLMRGVPLAETRAHGAPWWGARSALLRDLPERFADARWAPIELLRLATRGGDDALVVADALDDAEHSALARLVRWLAVDDPDQPDFVPPIHVHDRARASCLGPFAAIPLVGHRVDDVTLAVGQPFDWPQDVDDAVATMLAATAGSPGGYALARGHRYPRPAFRQRCRELYNELVLRSGRPDPDDVGSFATVDLCSPLTDWHRWKRQWEQAPLTQREPVLRRLGLPVGVDPTPVQTWVEHRGLQGLHHAYVDADLFRGEPPLAPAHLERIEAGLGLRFPPRLRTFLLTITGGAVDMRGARWLASHPWTIEGADDPLTWLPAHHHEAAAGVLSRVLAPDGPRHASSADEAPDGLPHGPLVPLQSRPGRSVVFLVGRGPFAEHTVQLTYEGATLEATRGGHVDPFLLWAYLAIVGQPTVGS